MGLFTGSPSRPAAARAPKKSGASRRSSLAKASFVASPSSIERLAKARIGTKKAAPKPQAEAADSEEEVDRLLVPAAPLAPGPPQSPSFANRLHDDEGDGWPEYSPIFSPCLSKAAAIGMRPAHKSMGAILQACLKRRRDSKLPLPAPFGVVRRCVLEQSFSSAFSMPKRAARFVSIHSIRRKELERDYCPPPQPHETCPRGHRCLGRCVLGFACPKLERRAS
ncbi:uncharacterized protein PFL1_06909 [Pseudozyma flocculosa PF-1]|uniref:Uncharacterized protein n=2 Tax=Pseudozyma flocculosa TaxID=84751 RepID=A0A5C3F1U9_9BASI|nr:uncharacterized protein PFL1_06909 [Pseudozyma flocculosa PF-1]EPQ26565.1 hypothetical protein PFL1_06909 [Pseudozyma flocculosa PF-1]SPO38444.1 uncharacterized protein PSFLO_03922 [Pseudozyma flocculosa]